MNRNLLAGNPFIAETPRGDRHTSVPRTTLPIAAFLRGVLAAF